MSAGVITTEARAVSVHHCYCGADRYPTLRRRGSKSHLVHYVCVSCGAKGVTAVTADRAAKNWNADMAHRSSP